MKWIVKYVWQGEVFVHLRQFANMMEAQAQVQVMRAQRWQAWAEPLNQGVA